MQLTLVETFPFVGSILKQNTKHKRKKTNSIKAD